jgi:hypothetical protein
MAMIDALAAGQKQSMPPAAHLYRAGLESAFPSWCTASAKPSWAPAAYIQTRTTGAIALIRPLVDAGLLNRLS